MYTRTRESSPSGGDVVEVVKGEEGPPQIARRTEKSDSNNEKDNPEDFLS